MKKLISHGKQRKNILRLALCGEESVENQEIGKENEK